jgi:hypothetical protein
MELARKRAIAKSIPTAAILGSGSDTTSYDQSPVHKPLETPEPLEQILSLVPSLDLCQARHTSQTFRRRLQFCSPSFLSERMLILWTRMPYSCYTKQAEKEIGRMVRIQA